MDETRNKVSAYLETHPFLNLATVDSEGRPHAHTVGFVSDAENVYFVTSRNSAKARNMEANPDVAFTVDEDYRQVFAIQGVQMRGRASLVKDREESGRVLAMVMGKFPQFGDLPSSTNYGIYRIRMTGGWFLDYTVEFGHREKVEY